MEWRNTLPEDVRHSMEEIVKSTESWKESFSSADNPGAAQLWLAVSLLHRRNKRLEEMVQAQRKALKREGIETDVSLDEGMGETLRRY